ncbi:hypothetical protein ATO46_03560 [Aeromonas schubertii]|uniref:nucleotidyltransferase family protein n=1 Tax=Aeromonas schubertii TaxID=652 RepID=UPI00067E716C|nr:nucleotidyltransferase family protein [Aeromonas schubertii]KUE80235.1 hypothetical protein ATO46_03560 [Aeromonas schubertii]
MPSSDLFALTRQLLLASPLHLGCLRAARTLNLPDWYLGAGFVRNLIWDHLHGHPTPTPLNDIDLIYLDPSDPEGQREAEHQIRIQALWPAQCWEVRNQARMHRRQHLPPFESSLAALSHWVELPTCVGVRLAPDDSLTLVAPHGLSHNWSLVVAPNPLCRQDPAIFNRRVTEKGWLHLWPRLRVLWPAQ